MATPTDNDNPERALMLPPGPSNPRNSEGAFVRLNDGNILFVYTHFTGSAGDAGTAHLASRTSSDDGCTWTTADTLVLPNEGLQNVMSVSLLRLLDGRIALFYIRKNSSEDCIPYLRCSEDEAQSWSAPVRCHNEEGYHVLNNDRVVQLPSGRLVMPLSLHPPAGPDRIDGNGIQMCSLSDDGGRTWRRSTDTLRSDVVLQEPGIVQLQDNRLMMFCRTNAHRQYVSFSGDEGDTWSPIEASNIVSPCSPASIKRIPKTGDLLMAWNDHRGIPKELETRRTPFTVAVSRDEGVTWEKTKTIEDDPDGWYCYTAMDFVGDHVLLGHCAGNRKTIGGLSQTQVTRFGIDWLYA